jgi:hypothetical protein
MTPLTVGSANPQALINAASAGGTVTIPPGLYFTGLSIDKSLTLNLAGVHLWGVAERKGVIAVACDGCTVVINDLTADGRRSTCTTSNCAGVKVEGIDFDVTINRANITGTVMGVLTDNRGGSLTVQDSMIADLGRYSPVGTYAHGVYAGNIDSLTVRDTTVAGSYRLGHLVKGRVPSLLLERVTLLGLETRHSRLVDIPCGSVDAVIADSSLIQGDQTDNPELMAWGGEAGQPNNCPNYYDGTLTLRNTALDSTRDHSSDEPARTDGYTMALKYYFAPTATPENPVQKRDFDLATDLILDGVTFGPGMEALAYKAGVYTPLPEN